MAEHGTRTMYTHYGCRCPDCCRAEHEQYLKRKESQCRTRNNSKWGSADYDAHTNRIASQRKHNAKRYEERKSREKAHNSPIRWMEIADRFNMRCALCGEECDSSDYWIGNDGRKRYGRRYPTVDHIIPLKLGGCDTFENVQLLCKHCNSAKGDRLE